MLTGVLVCLGVAVPASAEWFGDLYLGGSFTSKHDVETDSTGLTLTFQDVTFDNSIAGGGRAGYWFESLPFRSFGLNLGLGLDVSHFSPNISTQTRTITACVPRACAIGAAEFEDFDLSVTVIGFDAMLRYPLMKNARFPRGQLQPYFTVGPAIFIAHGSDSTNFAPSNQTDTDTSVGVKVGLGAAWAFTKNIAMFGEYRFTHFSPEFTITDVNVGRTTLSTDVNTHHLLVGVSFRF